MTFLFVYLIVPALGVLLYLEICRRMRNAELISGFLSLPLLLVFMAYGGVLTIFLMWLLELPWHGLASILFFVLLFVFPLVLGAVAWTQRNSQRESVYHRLIFLFSLAYTLLGIGAAIWFAA